MVESGLQRLYRFQHDDGGWGWWTNDETDQLMTAYVVFGLAVAKKAGVPVDAKTLERGLESLRKMEQTPFALYARATAGEDVSDALQAAASDLPDDGAIETVEDRAYLVLAGHRELAPALAEQPPIRTGPDQVRATALVVRALASVDPKDARIAPLVEWLMTQRRGTSWFSTLDTAYVVYALTEIANPQPAVEPTILLNSQTIAAREGRARLCGHPIKPGANVVQVRYGGSHRLFVSAMLCYRTDADRAEPQPQEIFKVWRRFERLYRENDAIRTADLESGDQVDVDDELRVTTTIDSEGPAARVLMESPIPAGAELRPLDPDDLWEHDRMECQDDRVSVAESSFCERHQFQFRLRPILIGIYRVPPATALEMYNPANRGASPPFVLRIVDRD